MSMSEAKHTPGPWTVSELNASGDVSEFHIFIEPGIAVIERKVDGHNDADMPDARLISAAPNLLEALKELVDLIELIRSDDYTPDSFTTQPARAAIAKATGAAQ